MNNTTRILCAAAIAMLALAACKNKPGAESTPLAAAEAQSSAIPGADSAQMPPGHPSVGAVATSSAAPADELITGKVKETMDAGSYTYVLVDDGKQKVWAATNHFDVKPGDRVTVPMGIKMTDYKSSALNRTFDAVYFVGSIANVSRPASGGAPADGEPASPHAAMGELAGQPMGPGGHPRVDAAQAARDANVSFSGLRKAGVTVAELYAGSSGLADKEVTLRGKVVKFNPGIMGRNWLHVQDGTGAGAGGDLTVTTASEAKVGDTVLITGKVTLNKDFGMGYKYALILEDAKVKVE